MVQPFGYRFLWGWKIIGTKGVVVGLEGFGERWREGGERGKVKKAGLGCEQTNCDMYPRKKSVTQSRRTWNPHRLSI